MPSCTSRLNKWFAPDFGHLTYFFLFWLRMAFSKLFHKHQPSISITYLCNTRLSEQHFFGCVFLFLTHWCDTFLIYAPKSDFRCLSEPCHSDRMLSIKVNFATNWETHGVFYLEKSKKITTYIWIKIFYLFLCTAQLQLSWC